jgi:hypothetical protein
MFINCGPIGVIQGFKRIEGTILTRSPRKEVHNVKDSLSEVPQDFIYL